MDKKEINGKMVETTGVTYGNVGIDETTYEMR